MKLSIRLVLAFLLLFQAQALVWAAPGREQTTQSMIPPTEILLAASQPKASSTEIRYLIEQNLQENLREIQSKSTSLKAEERYLIFAEKKKEPFVAFILNFLIGFGLGSFVNGDSEGGTTQLIGELSGFGVGAISATLASRQQTDSPMALVFGGLAFCGYLAGGIYRIGGWFRAFDFPQDYNDSLKKALNIDEKHSLLPYYENRSDLSGQAYPETGLVWVARF